MSSPYNIKRKKLCTLSQRLMDAMRSMFCGLERMMAEDLDYWFTLLRLVEMDVVSAIDTVFKDLRVSKDEI